MPICLPSIDTFLSASLFPLPPTCAFLSLITFLRECLPEIYKSQVRKANNYLRCDRSHVYHVCMCVCIFFLKENCSLSEESSSGRNGCSVWYFRGKVPIGSKYMKIQAIFFHLDIKNTMNRIRFIRIAYKPDSLSDHIKILRKRIIDVHTF